jgi:hypothetical protein
MKRHAWLIIAVLLLIGLSVTAVSCITVVMPDTEQGDSLPVINSFVSDPNSITPGASSMLSWNVSNATTVSIDRGIGSVGLTGSTSVSPGTTTTYTLTATNASGSMAAATQVLVVGTPSPTVPGGLPIINSFTATPPIILAASSATLSWDVSNTTSVSISPAVGIVGTAGSTSVSPSTTTNYTLTASNAAGTTVATIQVVVPTVTPSPSSTGLPIVHWFSANPESIVAGESSTLSWSVSNASSVIINPTPYRQLGSIDPAGNASVSPSMTTTYTLTATNSAGALSESVTVMVNPQPGTLPSFDWAGTWDTNWGIMHLSQSAGQVTGTYEHDNGKIVGYISKNLSGNILVGTWSESPSYAPPNDAGDIEWVASPDFNSFTGKWRYGSSSEWDSDWDGTWSGTRLTP